MWLFLCNINIQKKAGSLDIFAILPTRTSVISSIFPTCLLISLSLTVCVYVCLSPPLSFSPQCGKYIKPLWYYKVFSAPSLLLSQSEGPLALQFAASLAAMSALCWSWGAPLAQAAGGPPVCSSWAHHNYTDSQGARFRQMRSRLRPILICSAAVALTQSHTQPGGFFCSDLL